MHLRKRTSEWAGEGEARWEAFVGPGEEGSGRPGEGVRTSPVWGQEGPPLAGEVVGFGEVQGWTGCVERAAWTCRFFPKRICRG